MPGQVRGLQGVRAVRGAQARPQLQPGRAGARVRALQPVPGGRRGEGRRY